MRKKAAISGFWILVVIVILLIITGTNKITINDKQIKTANPSGCSLFNKEYDPVNRVCIIKNGKNNTQAP